MDPFRVKLTTLGLFMVGKTSIINQLISNQLDPTRPTINCTYYSKTYSFPDSFTCSLDIYDTAGQERYSSLTQTYLHGSKIVFFVVDLSIPQTSELLNKNIQLVKKMSDSLDLDQTIIYLIGNKSDLLDDQDLQKIDLQRIFRSIISPKRIFKISAKTRYNFDKMEQKLKDDLKTLYQLQYQKNEKIQRTVTLTSDNNVKTKKNDSCC